MKHNILKSLFISVILLAGTSNVWSADWHLQNNPSNIYFSDLTTNWVPTYASSHHIIFLMGRDNNYGNEGVGSQAYDMKYLTNTRLWYYNVPKWGDGDNGRYQYIAFRYATSAWKTWEGNTVTHRATYQNTKYTMTRNDNISGKTLYYEPESSAENTNTIVTGYLPKYTATADIKVSKDGGNTYTVTHDITLGVLTLTGTYMNGDDATGQTTETTDGTRDYKYENIPVTGEFTLTNTSVTNEAYEFVGFGTGDEPTINSNSHTWNVTANTTYYAFYKAKSYTITLDPQNGESTSTVTAIYGSAMPTIAKPQKTGYTFGGYWTNADGTGIQYYNAEGSSAKNWDKTSPTTLYAQWTPEQYNITYKDKGNATFSGTHETGYPTTHTYSTATTLKSATKTGYTFGGWYTSSDCTGSAITTLGATAYTAAITLYAKWTINTYNINYTAPTNGTYTIKVGSKDAVSANTTANYNETITLTNTPKKGYKFDEWTITPTVSITNSRTFSMPANDVTIAATFTLEEYSITYNLNGGSGTMTPTEYNVTTETFNLPTPTRTGYTFDGWYRDAEFTGEKVTTIAKGTTGNIELYAKWSETKYSVNINTNNRNLGITTPSGANWVGATPVNLTATPHTGYHFTEWKATGGAKIVDLNSPTTTITATASGTVTAHFAETLYNITVQSSNEAQGKVTQSADQAGVTTAITITADPIEGFEFTGWSKTSKTGDITIASINSATTTLTATGEGTVTANFAPKGSTPIYFKANHRWKQADAHFAVYYWDNKDENKNGWDKLEEICGEDYYKAEVPAGYTEFKFVRLDQTGTMNWDHDWNESVKHEVPTDGKTMFDTKKVYFRPNDNWKSDNARFAAYFLKNENNSINKWMSLLPTETDGLYWCDLPTTDDNGTTQYFDRVIFCRMTPSDTYNKWENRWNEAETQDILNINCFTINEGQWGKENNNDTKAPATGYWSLINDEATYNVTLYSCSFGEYGFIYNNVEYTSPESDNITYQIPINATVKVFSRPYSKEYRGDVMVKQGEDTRWEISPDNPLLNITCNTILDDNYKTTGEHEVYLAVPNNGGSWVTNTASLHYLYAFHDRTESGKGIPVQMTEVGHANVELNSQNVDHIYYRCVIPAEVNTIRFEKRSNATTTVLSTIDLRYDIPLNSVNCYRLDRKGNSNQSYAGVWEQAPGFGSDFRLVHYRAENDIYYSDIIRHGTISQVVSLHISTEYANAEYPRLELQQRNATNGNWVTVSGQTKLVKDINKIMNDQQDNGCGVWNFTVTTDGADKAEVNFNTPKRYTGNYYIRTNNAEGEWRNYTLSTNHMTFSSYAKNHSGYTHYYCRYIDLIDDSKVPGHNKNVKFIIANDYAANLSNEMIGDKYTTSGSDYTQGGDLPESANVRWTWNEVTNEVTRAYILGSHAKIDHIVATATNQTGQRLNDQEDWIYEIDLTGIKQEDKLNIHATYPSTTINDIEPVTQTFADNLEMIKTDDSNPNSYTVRVMYDFKINKTLIMLEPNDKTVNIGVDVLIDRTDQGGATQVQSTVISNEGYTVYSTLTLTKDHLLGNGTEWERLYYWISFPFDVRISEIFGFGEYGKHYIIQYYDGAARAENGCWADSPTYWRQITDTTYSARREADNKGNEDANGNPNNGILVANKGYVLALARNIAKSDIFKYGNEYVRLYFPSREKIKSIDGNMQNTTVYLRPHTCNITREDRYIYDSNWHIIGVPSYANKAQTLKEEDVLYFYTYNTANNTYAPTSAQGATVQFNSMHAYMVQFAGNIHWQSTWDLDAQSVVARRQSAETQEDYALRLELQRDGQYADQAFVQLKAEGATADFDINQDLTKIINAGANIYTLAGEKRIQVAGNVLPIAKTTIPVGIQVAQVGTYTIALPDGTSGISATLVDNQTGTHTNLLLEDYTITLDAGSHENRFYIVLDPERSATAVENIGDVQGDKTQKFLIDGQLIIRTEQGVYNATGGKVK